MRHFVIVGVLIVVLTPLAYFGMDAAHVMPIQASTQSLIIDKMWDWDSMAVAFLLCLIVVPLFYSLIVFRRKKGDTTDAEHIEGNTKLELTWTFLPLVLVLVYAYLGAYTLGVTRIADPNATVIKVTARQWEWTFDYPQGFTSNELHLLVNQQVVLKMTSTDVIHSFWVPEFRIKQDVVPGRTTEYRVTPDLVGNYLVRCAELCGASHAFMERPVIVTEQSDYDAWVAEQVKAALAASQTPEGRGQILVGANGCLGCHTTDGSKLRAPTWRGLYNSQVKLNDGSTVTADDAYLMESIINPNAKIVAGFDSGLMPTSFKDLLTEDQIKDIIAYIKTLK
ncbi:MAG TPA: cytochrome c oxidase subunit II [Anaerolineales bacterium]|nr:cytochrome c oxidase subunit II [Anaerolineales bacterium]